MQTFTSAIIAAVVLFGVSAFLTIKGREAKVTRLNAQRRQHVTFMRMAMDDPRYMECLGPYVTDNVASEAQFVYVNLIIAQLYSSYQIGSLTDSLLRHNVAGVFASVPGRQYWDIAGPGRRDNYSGGRARRFHRVLDEAYREALTKPPSTPPTG